MQAIATNRLHVLHTEQPHPIGYDLPVLKDTLKPLPKNDMDLIPGALYNVYGLPATFVQIVLVGFYEDWAGLFRRDDGTSIVVPSQDGRKAISPLTQKGTGTEPLVVTYKIRE